MSTAATGKDWWDTLGGLASGGASIGGIVPQAINAAKPDAISDAVSSAAENTVGAILPDGVNKLLTYATSPGFWKLVLVGWAGALLIVLALWGFVSTTKTGKQAIDLGVAAATKGAV